MRPEAKASLAREPGVQIMFTSMGSIWLVNKGTSKVELSAGELFGFNVGSFLEVQAGLLSIKSVHDKRVVLFEHIYLETLSS